MGSTRALACPDRCPAGRNGGAIQSLTVNHSSAPEWSARAPATARGARALVRLRVARSERCKSASGRSSSPGKPKGLRWGDPIVGSNGGKRLVRRITNPIRPDVLGEPASGERSPKLDENASSQRSMPVLKGERTKSQVGHIRWVGTEWWEDRAHEAGNPAGATGSGPLIGRKPCPAQVRASVVAPKRLIAVERRDAGR